jgi:hypothetical protein
VDIESDGIWRYAGARAVERDEEWWVALGSKAAKPVMPRGVIASEEAPKRTRASVPLHVAFEHLMEVEVLEGEQAAVHLAGHFAKYGGVELCRHGLPVWHEGRLRGEGQTGRRRTLLATSCSLANVDDMPAVSLRAVKTMLACWARVLDSHRTIANGHGFSAAVMTDLLAWPILSEPRRRQYQAASNMGDVKGEAARQVVTATVSATMRATRLTQVLSWPEQRRPGLGLRADTTLGLYAADLIARIGSLGAGGPYECDYCHLEYTPRRAPHDGDQRVCGRPSCRSARTRANAQAHRARGREQR